MSDDVELKPQFRRAVRALFLTRHQFEIDDADVFCNGELLSSAVRKFVASPEGQIFVAGVRPEKGGVPPIGKSRSQMTRSEKAEFCAKYGAAAYEALPK